jgi:predicted aspartyl protease
MATAYFPSLSNVDVVDAEFVKPKGGVVPMRLLVDSGFTGQSSFVLSHRAEEIVQALVAPSEAAGALRGPQRRTLVICRVPAISFEGIMIAIVADLGPLSLPTGVDGVAGLRFLRQFARWGGERTADRQWRFFLSDAES